MYEKGEFKMVDFDAWAEDLQSSTMDLIELLQQHMDLVAEVDKLKENTSTLDILKKNILNLGWSMQDAPFHGVSKDTIKGVNFAINKVLEGTGLTIESLLEEEKVAARED